MSKWGVYTIALICTLFAGTASAQVPVVGTEKITWDQVAPDLATAQGYAYVPLVDTTTNPAPNAPGLAGVVCAGTASPFVCQAPLIPLTTGMHAIRLVARIGTGPYSPQSGPLALLMQAIPVAPANLRLT